MTTSKNRQRVDAFRAWIGLIGGLDAAHRQTGIAMRSLERMLAGRKPPPARLLDRAADEIEQIVQDAVADRTMRIANAHCAMEVARDLRTAAQPMEATDA